MLLKSAFSSNEKVICCPVTGYGIAIAILWSEEQSQITGQARVSETGVEWDGGGGLRMPCLNGFDQVGLSWN